MSESVAMRERIATICGGRGRQGAGSGTLKEWPSGEDPAMELRHGSDCGRRREAGGRKNRIGASLERCPDIVLRELQHGMREVGTVVSIAHLARVLRRLGLRLRKGRSMPPCATPKPTASAAKPLSRRSQVAPEDLI